MDISKSDPSVRSNRPASISSTSSLDSLLHEYRSSTFAMEDDFEETTLPTLDENDDHCEDEQRQCEPGSMGDAAQSSVISPGAPPLSTNLDSSTPGHPGQHIPSLVLPPVHGQGAPQPPLSPGGLASGTASGSQAPEFLYQLTKMLTDDNRDTIEWCNGKIEVHSPHRLEADVLHKYFRHSKFASFQRQLNYFGFRKQAGKGKMAPCSYVNENLPSHDLNCFLHIKRKTSVSMSAKEKEKLGKKKDMKGLSKQASELSTKVNPVLAGILERSSAGESMGKAPSIASKQPTATSTHQDVAQAAVGRGIRHSFNVSALPPPLKTTESSSTKETSKVVGGATAALSNAMQAESSSGSFNVNNPLSQLATNYQNSLNDMLAGNESVNQDSEPTPVSQMQNQQYSGSFLSRDDSLVDLAMIPLMDDSDGNDYTYQTEEISSVSRNNDDKSEDNGFSFIDFPNPDVFPLNKGSQSST